GFGAADRERVESDARADPTGLRTAVAERQRHHAIGHPWEDPDRKLEGAARVLETDDILVRQTERFGGLRAHERGVVPRELCQGMRKFLQPPFVCEAAVVHRRRGQEDDLQASARAGPNRARKLYLTLR